MIKLRRRSFIILLVAATGTAVLTFFGLDFKRVVRRILVKDTEELEFETENAIDLFMEEADKELFWNRFYFRRQIFLCVHHYFHIIGISLPRHHIYLADRDAITGQFLLSTDLFWKHRRTAVSYQGFYHPYRKPCLNPFASSAMLV